MMNQYQVAAYIVPVALRVANHAGETPLDDKTLIQLSSALSSAVSAYTSKERKAILKAGLKISPDFNFIAEDFFLVLKETPVIAEKARSKQYESIAEFIIANKELTTKERLTLYREQYASASVKFWKAFRIVCLCVTLLSAVLVIGQYLCNPKMRQQLKDRWNEMKYQYQKTKRHAKRFFKAMKFLVHQLTK